MAVKTRRKRFVRTRRNRYTEEPKKLVLNLDMHVPNVYRHAFNEFLKESKREFVFKGGRGSVKSSIAALMAVVTVVQEKGNSICIRRHKAHIYDSCYADVVQVIERLGLEKDFTFKKSPMIIIHKSGYSIYFRGLDDPLKIKSIRPKKGTFEFAWFEEANENESIEKLYNVRASLGRGEGNNLIVAITYNPPESPLDWVNVEFEQGEDDTRIVLHTTYKDVPYEWLGDSFFALMEKIKKKDYDLYLNMYEGKIVSGKSTVFKNVKRLDPSRIPFLRSQANYISRGLDFGKVDPNAYVSWYYSESSNSIYLLHEDYGSDMLIKDLADIIKKDNPYNNIVYADNAGSQWILELNDLGCDGVLPCIKGPNSVDFGVKWLQSLDAIYIPEYLPDGRPSLAYKEFSLYRYAVNKNGELLAKNPYPDKDNHTIDATRYALQDYIYG